MGLLFGRPASWPSHHTRGISVAGRPPEMSSPNGYAQKATIALPPQTRLPNDSADKSQRSQNAMRLLRKAFQGRCIHRRRTASLIDHQRFIGKRANKIGSANRPGAGKGVDFSARHIISTADRAKPPNRNTGDLRQTRPRRTARSDPSVKPMISICQHSHDRR